MVAGAPARRSLRCRRGRERWPPRWAASPGIAGEGKQRIWAREVCGAGMVAACGGGRQRGKAVARGRGHPVVPVLAHGGPDAEGQQDVEEREEAGRVARVDERDRRLEDALARAREVDELGDRRVQARLERGRWSKEGDGGDRGSSAADRVLIGWRMEDRVEIGWRIGRQIGRQIAGGRSPCRPGRAPPPAPRPTSH